MHGRPQKNLGKRQIFFWGLFVAKI